MEDEVCVDAHDDDAFLFCGVLFCDGVCLQVCFAVSERALVLGDVVVLLNGSFDVVLVDDGDSFDSACWHGGSCDSFDDVFECSQLILLPT